MSTDAVRAKQSEQKNYYGCGLNKTVNIIGSKWTIPIIYSLLDGPRRFAWLQDELKLNPRTLSLRLKELEYAGIVLKNTYSNSGPLRTEYSLTKKGITLNGIIGQMEQWGECSE